MLLLGLRNIIEDPSTTSVVEGTTTKNNDNDNDNDTDNDNDNDNDNANDNDNDNDLREVGVPSRNILHARGVGWKSRIGVTRLVGSWGAL